MAFVAFELDKLLALAAIFILWISIHCWRGRHLKGPKAWPVIGAAVEHLKNYDRMHDWLAGYLSESKTITVRMPFTTYTYIADPANVEYVLKTNFTNYPKVKNFPLRGLFLQVMLILIVSASMLRRGSCIGRTWMFFSEMGYSMQTGRCGRSRGKLRASSLLPRT